MDIAVGIVEHDNKYAFLQRVDGNWTFPSGKVEIADASLELAALREVCEETGLVPDDLNYVKALGERDIGENRLSYHYFHSSNAGLINSEPQNFLSVEWITAAEIIAVTKGRLFEPVKELLELKV